MYPKFAVLIISVFSLIQDTKCETPLPIVMWHGMGDTCCLPFSMGSIKKLFEENIEGVYVNSLKIGGNAIDDYRSGFFIHPNKQIEDVCNQIKNDQKLANGYNAIGFSQGGQFLRAIAQRCPQPPMRTLITMGAQHQGIFGLPKCPSVSFKTCEYFRNLLSFAAYERWVQKKLVQATYWHDPLREDKYREKSTFIAEINNEHVINSTYVTNLQKLKKFVMVKFMNDTIVQPRESQWFEFYKPDQDIKIQPFKESSLYLNDYLGLRKMDQDGKIVFLETEGDHLQSTSTWYIKNIVPYFKED